MSSSTRIPPDVDAASARLLARAYDLATPEDTRNLYHDWAETYDTTMLDGLGYVSPVLVSGLLGEHLKAPDAPIVDIGCGTGLAGQNLADLGFTHIDALDFSAEMLAVAARRGIYRDLLEADLTQPLALPDAHWAAAVCSGTFTHGHVGPSCLSEILRILKPGGLFAFTVNKGVWHEMGFENELALIEKSGQARRIERRDAINYKNSPQPDSLLNLYERL